MIIDCDGCAVRGDACGDCVVGVLLGIPEPATRPGEAPPGASMLQLDAPERRALDVLADQGLVPRLRLVAGPPRRATSEEGQADPTRHAG